MSFVLDRCVRLGVARHADYKFAWKTLMTSYNLGMCVYSGVTAYLSVTALGSHTGVLTGSTGR
jgi:hypothetical protein